MKTSVTRLLCLILSAMPVLASAQSNIQSAFNALIKSPDAQITESHVLEKDPDTDKKTSQCDVYNFVLPADQFKLIKNIVNAIDKDSKHAYGLYSGRVTSTDQDIILAVGDGNGNNNVSLTDLGGDYSYAAFLAPKSEDPEGIYRYAYGISYKQSKKNDNIIGKLVVTYATTLKYRQQVAVEKQQSQWKMLNKMNKELQEEDSWFDMLMSYFQSMSDATSKTRIALATKAFKVIRDSSKYPEVTIADKVAIREILKVMVSDNKYSESVLNKLLNQCLAELK
ncbi:MAG: hypothetical protein K2I08_09225 [Muribaculaceae bacterium]|nr:hypothetical protein [Muribaculaceae bacterium]MDE6522424.1 hypothetical protein [Muribaculaceae bacterium]